VTQIINNPTLISEDHGSTPPFFRNKGAVTGVFVVVGVLSTAIVFFVLSYFRRRRELRKRDRDATVAETLAEHGIMRQDLIDPDDHHPVNDQRAVITPTGSGSSARTRRTSSPSMSLTGFTPMPVSSIGFNHQSYNQPYHADTFGQTYDSYGDNQMTYPGPSASSRVQNSSPPSVSHVSRPFFSHGTRPSAASIEPLLGAFSESDTPPRPIIPPVPPRNPSRVTGSIRHTQGDIDIDNRGSPNDGNTGHGDYDDDDVRYSRFRQGSLRVRNNPD